MDTIDSKVKPLVPRDRSGAHTTSFNFIQSFNIRVYLNVFGAGYKCFSEIERGARAVSKPDEVHGIGRSESNTDAQINSCVSELFTRHSRSGYQLTFQLYYIDGY